MPDFDQDNPDLTALALGEATGEPAGRALELLLRSEEARAMTTETLVLAESLSRAFGGEPAAGGLGPARVRILSAARQRTWSQGLRRGGLAAAACGLVAAATIAGAAALPPGTWAAGQGAANLADDAGPAADENAVKISASTPGSGALEFGLPVAAAGDAGGVYHLSLSADAVQAVADNNWKFAFGPQGEATFGPVPMEPAAEPPGGPSAAREARSIDDFVAKRLEKLGIATAGVSDESFLRRLYLDTTGAPPSPAELAAFVNDPAGDKRERVAGRLLADGVPIRFAGEASAAAAYGLPAGYGVADSADASSRFVTGLGVGDDSVGGAELFMRETMSGLAAHPGASPADIGASYPAEVRSIVEELDGRIERAREEAAQSVRGDRLAALERLQRVQDEFTRGGRLDDALAVRTLIRKLEGDLFDARPDPGRLTSYRGQAGREFHFRVAGDPHAGIVWGTDVYTDDSSLAAAAVHAGAVGSGETGLVKVTILPGQAAYSASSRHGVASNAYGPWQGSYRVERAGAAGESSAAPLPPVGPPPTADPQAWSADEMLAARRGQPGQSFVARVIGDASAGPVWGTDVYTDDSSVAAAAVHAGVLKPGEAGEIVVVTLSGQATYAGSTRNGVTSREYPAWGGSYRIYRVGPPAAGSNRAADVADDPGTFSTYDDHPRGSTFRFRVTGSAEGPVWGTDVYSSDSDLSTAAVHAGLLRPGESGVVEATLVEGQAGYIGSDRNGVTSRDWQSWRASYRLGRVDGEANGHEASRASVNGKYRGLLATVQAPGDRASYGEFRDYGRWDGTAYLGQEVPSPAFWVYVAPTWFLWSEVNEPAATPLGSPVTEPDVKRPGDETPGVSTDAATSELRSAGANPGAASEPAPPPASAEPEDRS